MARDVVVVIGAGGIGMAIARRQGFGKTLLLADYNEQLLQAAAEELCEASYAVEARQVDVASRLIFLDESGFAPASSAPMPARPEGSARTARRRAGIGGG